VRWSLNGRPGFPAFVSAGLDRFTCCFLEYRRAHAINRRGRFSGFLKEEIAHANAQGRNHARDFRFTQSS
jgi:hypothetical protein